MKSSQKTEKKIVLVLGASRLGASIASFCSKEGIYAVIVDENKAAFKKVDPNFSGFFVEGNAEDVKVLNKAHIQEAKEINIVTGDDDTNIFLACLVERFYSVPYINVRLIDMTKEKLLPSNHVSIISPSSLTFNCYQDLKRKEEKE